MIVVGLVLAAPERNVRGSESCDEEDLDGVGEGGEVGGKGRMEASSSASNADLLVHIESAASEFRSERRLRAAEGEGKSWSSLRTTVREGCSWLGTI
jgi:hypothetical protein